MLVIADIFVAIIALWTGCAVYIASAVRALMGVIVETRIKNEPGAATATASASIGMVLLALTASKWPSSDGMIWNGYWLKAPLNSVIGYTPNMYNPTASTL